MTSQFVVISRRVEFQEDSCSSSSVDICLQADGRLGGRADSSFSTSSRRVGRVDTSVLNSSIINVSYSVSSHSIIIILLLLSLSPLYRVFTRMPPRQTMSLGDTLLQLLFCFIVNTVYGAYLPRSYVGSDGLLLLLLSLSLSPLYRVFICMSPRQTMSLGDTLLQLLFCFIYYYYYYYYYYYVVVSCHRLFITGTFLLKLTAVPTNQASSFRLCTFSCTYVWCS